MIFFRLGWARVLEHGFSMKFDFPDFIPFLFLGRVSWSWLSPLAGPTPSLSLVSCGINTPDFVMLCYPALSLTQVLIIQLIENIHFLWTFHKQIESDVARCLGKATTGSCLRWQRVTSSPCRFQWLFHLVGTAKAPLPLPERSLFQTFLCQLEEQPQGFLANVSLGMDHSPSLSWGPHRTTIQALKMPHPVPSYS